MSERRVTRCKKISTRCWKWDRSWRFESTHDLEGHKLRVQIRRDVCDGRSCARVERWDGTKWQIVCSKPICLCFCREFADNMQAEDFQPDELELLREALNIVFF